MKKILLLFLLLACSTAIFAQRSKLRDLESQRKLALQEIENTDRLLRDTKINTSSLLTRIKLISNQIETRQRIVTLLEQEVEGISVEEQKIAEEVVVLQGELGMKKDAYQKAITSMMRNRQSDNKLLFVLSGKSLTESYRRFRYLKDYSDWRRRQADEIVTRNQMLATKQDSLKIAKKEKEDLLQNRATEQQKLKEEEDNYQSEMVKIEENQKDLQRILEQKKNQAKALDQQIQKLIAQEVIRQEKKAKREQEEEERKAKAAADKAKKQEELAEKTATTKPSTTKPAETKPAEVKPKDPTPAKIETVATSAKENIKLSTNFASNKGKLPYPISGNYSITSRFGPQKHGKWVTTASSGIDIQSQANAQARAVFAGEVTTITSIPGYGSCVLIRHGSYYTFYGNIKGIAVKKGDKVNTGQALGSVYTDPDTNISQMHFQLWQSKANAAPEKLNPEPWLQ